MKLGFSVVGNSRVAQTIKLVRLGDFLNLNYELPFVVDLTKIDFLDSSGLGALVQTAKECKKSKLGFSVVGNSRVAQTIKLVRLGDFLNLNSSLEDALNYLKN